VYISSTRSRTNSRNRASFLVLCEKQRSFPRRAESAPERDAPSVACALKCRGSATHHLISHLAVASLLFRHCVVLGMAWAAVSLLTHRAQAASFTGLGKLPGAIAASDAHAVSADGSVVVGGSVSPSGSEAFYWSSGGGLVGLGDLSGGTFQSIALAISADGSVVVGNGDSSSGAEAFRWTSEGGMVGLGDLNGGSFDSVANGISADGSVVVGRGGSSSGFEAFRWTNGGGMVGLGDLTGGSFNSEANAVSADGSVVVGRGDSSSGLEAFRWTATEGMVGLGDLLFGAFSSEANAVSANGSVIVGGGTSGSGPEAFRWVPGLLMSGLGDLPGGDFYSVAYGVSGDGSTVVGRGLSALGVEAFIWDATNGMRNLKDVLSPDVGTALDGWTLAVATAISADGRTVVGFGTTPSGWPGAWLAYLADDISWSAQASGVWDSVFSWTGPYLPGPDDDVVISPAATLTVTGPSENETINSLTLGDGTGVATLQLSGATAGDLQSLNTTTIEANGVLRLANGRTFTAPVIANSGIIRGDGVLAADLTVLPGGELRVSAGQRLHVISTFGVVNLGRIEAIGAAADQAEVEFDGSVDNSSAGLFVSRDALLRFNDGFNNGGVWTVSFGTTDVFGDLTNLALATIAVAGNSGITFYDDVTNSGTLNVHAGSTAVFFGALSGNGNVGGGAVQALGDLLPGSSPGLMAFGGDLTLGPLTNLEIQIAGLMPGSQYDQLTVAGDLTLGGMLNVSFLSLFPLSPGQVFEIIDVDGSTNGIFTGLSEGSLVSTFGGSNLIITYQGGDGNDVALLAALPGDFDFDLDVDGDDFLLWQRGGSPTPFSATDLADWETYYGQSWPAPLAASAAVPEPFTCGLMLMGLACFTFRRGQQAPRP
jgi:probable HAF family extracellular repeat protein